MYSEQPEDEALCRIAAFLPTTKPHCSLSTVPLRQVLLSMATPFIYEDVLLLLRSGTQSADADLVCLVVCFIHTVFTLIRV